MSLPKEKKKQKAKQIEVQTTNHTTISTKKGGISLNGEETEAQRDAKWHTLSHNDSMSLNLSSKTLAFQPHNPKK